MSTSTVSPLKAKIQAVIRSNFFNVGILATIVLNGILVGVQTYDSCPDWVQYIQLFILFIFFLEIMLRWMGRNSTTEYLSDGWNYFDIVILLAGVAPEIADIIASSSGQESQSSVWATLRVLRIVQLTRSIRAVEDLRILIGVLIKSIRSLSYIAILFLLIMYMYAVVGVTLFKNRDYKHSEHLELTISNPDPYGHVGEAFFTLFRILTGEDWTDLRYNLLNNEHTQRDDGKNTVPRTSNFTVTFYHVSWMVVAAYLLMNLVVGAIVSNFQLVLDAKKADEDRENGGDDNNPPPDGGGDAPKRRIIKKPKV